MPCSAPAATLGGAALGARLAGKPVVLLDQRRSGTANRALSRFAAAPRRLQRGGSGLRCRTWITGAGARGAVSHRDAAVPPGPGLRLLCSAAVRARGSSTAGAAAVARLRCPRSALRIVPSAARPLGDERCLAGGGANELARCEPAEVVPSSTTCRGRWRSSHLVSRAPAPSPSRACAAGRPSCWCRWRSPPPPAGTPRRSSAPAPRACAPAMPRRRAAPGVSELLASAGGAAASGRCARHRVPYPARRPKPRGACPARRRRRHRRPPRGGAGRGVARRSEVPA